MRYRDADHVNMGSFYARSPQLGKIYRLLGYAAIVMAAFRHDQPGQLERLLIFLVVLWLMAWYRIVGTLWRSSIVAAIVLCASLITFSRLPCATAACPFLGPASSSENGTAP